MKIANRLSFVGSIGVVGSYLDFSGLLEEHNVTYQRFVGGKYKDFGSPFVEPSEDAKDFFQKEVDIVYEIFISDVAKFRDMSEKEVKELAHGMVYTGVQGLELNLIDEIGGKKEAVAYIEDNLNITADIIEYKKKVSFWSLLTSSQSKKYYSVGRGIGDSIIESTTEPKILI